MYLQLAIPALLMGIISSLHCIGMCGPISLLIQGKKLNLVFITGRLLYNLGRIFTYAILGFLFGLLGSGMKLLGLQQILSIVLGCSIVIYFILPIGLKLKMSAFINNKLIIRLKKAFGFFLKIGGVLAHFCMGVLNGFLPCGMVYAALTLAVLQDSVLESVHYMTFFGLGTVPTMFLLAFLPHFHFFQNIKLKLGRYSMQLVLVLALLLIMRGLGLGIPYLSPAQAGDAVVGCY